MGYRQAVQVEEKRLLKALVSVYKKIQFDLRKSGAAWSEIESIYHQKTDDIIRSSVTTFYELAAKKTVEQEIRVPYFLTQQDLIEIRRLAQKYQEAFWMALNREVNMHDTLGVKQYYDPETLMLVREEDTRLREGFIGRIVQSVHGEVVAMGTLSKARQVILQHNVARAVKLLQGAIKVKSGATTSAPSVPHLTWKISSESENVCPQCEALDESSYELDDPDTPIPSVDTHPRCKCELVLEDAELEEEEEVVVTTTVEEERTRFQPSSPLLSLGTPAFLLPQITADNRRETERQIALHEEISRVDARLDREREILDQKRRLQPNDKEGIKQQKKIVTDLERRRSQLERRLG